MIFDSFFKSLPLFMDYDGQHRAEYYFELIVSLSGLAGLVFGYYYQLFSVAVYCLGVGFVLASLISIPPWPMYRRKPLKWQKHDPANFVCDHSQPAATTNTNTISSSSSNSSTPATTPQQSTTGKSSKKSSGGGGGGKNKKN